MAGDALIAIRDHHLRVPEDVIVVGFDDVPLASYVSPPHCPQADRSSIVWVSQLASRAICTGTLMVPRKPGDLLHTAAFLSPLCKSAFIVHSCG